MRTLFIVNPHAAGGRAARIFHKIQNRLGEVFGDSFIAVTQTPEEVAGHINRAAQDGLTHLIAVGGDGTNHIVLNALFQHPVPGITFGCISVGTGSDWRRSMGAPSDPFAALEWLARAKAVPCDLGKIEYRDF
ncbi:MAG TPA: acylglycerol kinase family protein, partial [bacterium]